MLTLLLLAGGAMAEEVAGRGAIPVLTREMRTYFADLSDAEYASLRPAPVLYPVLAEAWARGPLSGDSLGSYEPATYAEDADVERQAQLLAASYGPQLRSRTIYELSQSASPAAIALLVRQLTAEQDPSVLADVLRRLGDHRVTTLGDAVTPFLTAAATQVRFAAYPLYALQPGTDIGQLLARAEAEPDRVLRCRALTAAASRATEADFARWLALAKGEPEVVASALAGLLRFALTAEQQATLRELVRGAGPRERFAVAEHLRTELPAEFNVAMVQLLAEDTGAAIRAATARAIGRLALPATEPTLVALAKDAAPEVRLAAVQALAHFPDETAFNALLERCAEPDSRLIREAARDSLLALVPRYPVAQRIAAGLASPDVEVRNIAYQVVCRLVLNEHNALLQRQLPQETRGENLGHLIRALALGGAKEAGPGILAHARHEDPRVRAAVAEACGRLLLAETDVLLAEYALNDRQQVVRFEAIVAMGRLGHDAAGEPLLTLLKRTNLSRPDASSETDRAAACWTLARLPALAPAVLQRLQAQIRTPVIQTEMGPAYDGDTVRVSACWALVAAALQTKDPAVRAAAESMIEVLKMPDPDANTPMGGGMPIPTSDMLRAYGAELEDFLAHEPIERHRVPLGVYRFSLTTADQQ
jgi:HEAT repeat protein